MGAVGWRQTADTRVPLARPMQRKVMRKVRVGSVTPVYEKYVLKALGIAQLR